MRIDGTNVILQAISEALFHAAAQLENEAESDNPNPENLFRVGGEVMTAHTALSNQVWLLRRMASQDGSGS